MITDLTFLKLSKEAWKLYFFLNSGYAHCIRQVRIAIYWFLDATLKRECQQTLFGKQTSPNYQFCIKIKWWQFLCYIVYY